MSLVVYAGAIPTDGTSVLSWHREEPPFLLGYKPSRMVVNLTMGVRLSCTDEPCPGEIKGGLSLRALSASVPTNVDCPVCDNQLKSSRPIGRGFIPQAGAVIIAIHPRV
jgi:hypothetical protein